MARTSYRRARGQWQVWPRGEAATQALQVQGAYRDVSLRVRGMLDEHRPSWKGRTLRAWLVGTDTSFDFVA